MPDENDKTATDPEKIPATPLHATPKAARRTLKARSVAAKGRIAMPTAQRTPVAPRPAAPAAPVCARTIRQVPAANPTTE